MLIRIDVKEHGRTRTNLEAALPLALHLGTMKNQITLISYLITE